jgi:hypothetical protein
MGQVQNLIGALQSPHPRTTPVPFSNQLLNKAAAMRSKNVYSIYHLMPYFERFTISNTI